MLKSGRAMLDCSIRRRTVNRLRETLLGFIGPLMLVITGCAKLPIPEVNLNAPHIEIAFSTTRGVETHWVRGTIFVMTADGSHQAALADDVGGGRPASAPTWSPHGKCIAFADIMTSEETERYGSGVGLVILCTDGTSQIIPGGLYGAWSPDGKEIAYYGLEQGGKSSSINVVELHSGQAETLISGLGGYEKHYDGLRLSWSPSGEQIVYELDDPSGEWGIYIMSRDGTQRQFLTRGRRPEWSPTRPEIAFDDEGALWLINADGSERRALTSGEGDDRWPSWSPDGETLVFESYRDGNGEIYRIGRDGTGLMRLTDNPAWDGKPAWRPRPLP